MTQVVHEKHVINFFQLSGQKHNEAPMITGVLSTSNHLYGAETHLEHAESYFRQ